MLDNLNNKILNYLERKSWRLSDVYWRLIGDRISTFYINRIEKGA